MRQWPLRTVRDADEFRRRGWWADRTIADDARRRAEQGTDDVFLNEDQPTRMADLIADAEALLASMQSLGLRRGDVVTFMLPNWYEAAVVNLAAAMGGLVVNPIVPIYRDAETQHILSDCESSVIFIPAVFRKHDYVAMIDRMRGSLPHLCHVITVRGHSAGALCYADLVSAGRGARPQLPRVDPASLKMVMYTSGTTGRAKAVLHSHETLARAVDASAEFWGVNEGDVVLMPSPVTHVSGYSNGLERPFLGGTRTILMETWDAAEAVRLVDRFGATMTVAATPFLAELVDAAVDADSRLPSFRTFACGGAAVPSDLVRRANAVTATPCAFRVYGSSEAPFVTLGFDPGASPDLAAESDGRIVDYDVQIQSDDGMTAQGGEQGEIVVKGPALFLGYGDPAQTAESFTADGYFRTGDVGRFCDEHGLVITDRKKDLIIRGGENLSPKEIEEVLHMHPAIREASIVAMPHDRLGEGVCAFVVLEEGARVTLDEIRSFVDRAGLAKQKAPERVEIVDELPRTASGKVRKDLLRGHAGRAKS